MTGISNNLYAVIPAEIAGLVDLSAYTEYMDYVVDALNAHLFTYAAINTNTTYVEDPTAQSVYDALHVQFVEEGEREVIRIENEAAYSFSADGNVLNVRNDVACVVIVKEGETYTKLTAAENADGSYAYDLSGVAADAVIYIVIKGDFNLDGVVDMKDATNIVNAWVNKSKIDELSRLAADVSESEEIEMADATLITNAWVHATGFSW